MGVPLPASGLAAILAIAQPPSAPPERPLTAAQAADQQAASPADDGDDPATTAVALQDDDTRMTVKVTINGAGPFRFIVDSGATRTVISRELATMLRLPAAGHVALHSVGGESEVGSVRIAAMTLGDLPARTIVAPVLEAKNLGAAGILGIDALDGKKVVIDMATHSMSVQSAGGASLPAANPNEIVVVARRRYGQLVLADADAAGQRIYAIVDTGSMLTIGNSQLMTRLVRRHRAAPATTIITDVTGRAITASYAPISVMRLGRWQVAGLSIAFSDTHAFERFGLSEKPAMLLGMDMMRAFERVSIDFKHHRVLLTKRGELSI